MASHETRLRQKLLALEEMSGIAEYFGFGRMRATGKVRGLATPKMNT